jgi:hypothetical protein
VSTSRVAQLENALAPFTNPVAEAAQDDPAQLDSTLPDMISDNNYTTLVIGLGTTLDRPTTARLDTELIYTGDNLASQSADLHYSSKIERIAARIFDERHLRLIKVGDTVRNFIEWTVVLRLTVEDFQLQPSGMFHYRVRGVLIEVTEACYLEILAAHLSACRSIFTGD